MTSEFRIDGDVPELKRTTLTLRDILVLKFHHRMTQEDMVDVGERVQRIFPGIRYLVLDEDTDVEVIRDEQSSVEIR